MRIDAQHPLLLGSGSPRRRRLLARVGVPHMVRVAQVDEAAGSDEDARSYLERIVAAKLAAVASLFATDAAISRCAALLVADTVVVQRGAILGKPASDAEAHSMIDALAGNEHRVVTRFAIAKGAAAEQMLHASTVSTIVRFRSLDSSQIARYVATGEGRDKAGAYAIQGTGSMLVRSIEGSYTNVVGLPICAVVEKLQALGMLGPLPLVPPVVEG